MKIIFAFLLLLSVDVYAADFIHLRDDQTIPEHCQSSETSDFLTHDLKYYTYSRTGGERRGFDHEVIISREDIRTLWGIFKGGHQNSEKSRKWANSNSDRFKYYHLILNNFELMDFNFNDEGQVLEILALLEIKQSLDKDLYVTGSVAYSGSKGKNRIGELDVVVGDKETCQIIYVGEVKINPRRLGHARSQLQRFRRFLDSYK